MNRAGWAARDYFVLCPDIKKASSLKVNRLDTWVDSELKKELTTLSSVPNRIE